MKINSTYTLNSTLLFPFLVTCSVLSLILPISADNLFFKSSVILFILSTLSIPLSEFVLNRVRGLSLKYKTYKYFEIFHGITLILAIISFLIWILNLSFKFCSQLITACFILTFTKNLNKLKKNLILDLLFFKMN